MTGWVPLVVCWLVRTRRGSGFRVSARPARPRRCSTCSGAKFQPTELVVLTQLRPEEPESQASGCSCYLHAEMNKFLGVLRRVGPAVLSSSLADEFLGIFVEGTSTLLRTEVVGSAMIGRLCFRLTAVELHAANGIFYLGHGRPPFPCPRLGGGIYGPIAAGMMPVRKVSWRAWIHAIVARGGL